MKQSLQIIVGIMLVAFAVIGHVAHKAMGAVFSQIVLPFSSEKKFSYEWLKAENTLVMQFPGTSPNEVEALNHYDERLIRRMIVKDLGATGTEVKLVLQNKDVRALVSSFKDPFRITVDLFHKDYSQKKDPTTGLPEIEPVAPISTPASSLSTLDQPTNSGAIASSRPETEPHSSNDDTSRNPSKRRLLQALPEEINSPNELKVTLEKIPPGVGKGWTLYPIYIYRAQLAPYEGREAPSKDISPYQSKAVMTSTAMADYAGKLYDFGHETRALAAYEQVLLKQPGVFQKDPIHLWKFAECHLGQGNFLLADGYYKTLLDKFPSHALAKFSQLRRLDIEAIKSIQKSDISTLPAIAKKLSTLNTKDNAEILAQMTIRKAWWSDPQAEHGRTASLPNVSEDVQRTLTTLVPNVESQKTAFLASSMIANRMVQSDTPWEDRYAVWLAEYFDRFKGPGSELLREKLSQETKQRISQEFKHRFDKSEHMAIVKMFEGLPSGMKSLRKSPEVAWILAESYRLTGQMNKSVPFYQTAAELPGGTDRFKALLWLNMAAGSNTAELEQTKGNQENIRNLQNISAKADQQMLELWAKLKSDEKAQILTGMNDAIEENVASDLKAKAPPTILLDKWTSALAVNPPKMSAENGTNPVDTQANFSVSAGTVRLLDDLGRKFGNLGMQPERRKALELMRFIKPSSFEGDKTVQKLWSKQLLDLAEEHRKANEFLEAGQIYSSVGDAGVTSENRAEAYYKGGLLLFRAGKKQEAIEALEKAKADSNNLFYSKLASERLDQLTAH